MLAQMNCIPAQIHREHKWLIFLFKYTKKYYFIQITIDCHTEYVEAAVSGICQ